MKFVSTHLTKHHLLHAPHRWFLAFLLSPIHALEVHYQRRYHLKFSHARKLFIFDMLLLISIFVIGGSAAFWYTYDPTVTKDVALEVSAAALGDTNRVKSGELITVKISFQNNSNVVLEDPIIKVNIPAGFLIRSTPPNFTTSTQSISVESMKPRQGGELIFTGQFFGEPGKNFPAVVELIYRQEKTNRFEVKTVGILATPADSVLVVNANFPATIFSSGNWEVPVTIQNTGSELISGISIPFPTVNGLNFSWLETGITKKPLLISLLKPNETTTGTLRFSSKLPKDISEISVSLIPQIQINNQYFNQAAFNSKISVLHPGLKISSEWKQSIVQPGESVPLHIKVENTGSVELNNLTLAIPLPANLVNVRETATTNKATLKGSTLYISAKEFPALNSIPRQETRELPLTIIISNRPSGSTELSLPISASSNIVNNPEKFETKSITSPIKLGTFISLNAESHYYSTEGDQIGRGPLPPKVGKETKYWALLILNNGTAEASNVSVSATLAPGVTWTSKSSVTRGREPVYNPSTRTITWNVSSVPASETVGIDFELSITPTESQRGSIPVLLTNIRASAVDSITNKNLTASAGSLNASLVTDTIGKAKGVRVE